MTAQTNFDKNLPKKMQPEAKLAMKDDYSFGFLELADEHTEHELERVILSKVTMPTKMTQASSRTNNVGLGHEKNQFSGEEI